MPVELGGNVDTTATRPGEGQVFVRLPGTVTGRCATGCSGAALASSGIARLVTDGNGIPPSTLSFNEVLADGQRLDIDLVFEVPAGAAEYVLRFESGTGERIGTPLTVPSGREEPALHAGSTRTARRCNKDRRAASRH